jgi:hypothetical protein
MSETVPPKGDNRDLFKKLDEQMEGVIPGFSERLEKLNREHLGRAIIIMGKKEDQSSEVKELTKAIKSIQGKGSPDDMEDQALPEGNNDYLAGYILPVQADQEKHVMILKTGIIAITQPKRDDREYYVEQYKKDFSPNEYPMMFPNVWGKDTNRLYEDLLKDNYCKVILSNQKPEDVPQVMEALDQSLVLAKELKVTREKAKQDSLKGLMGKLDAFFNEGKPGPSADQTPPPAPPSSGPGPDSSI